MFQSYLKVKTYFQNLLLWKSQANFCTKPPDHDIFPSNDLFSKFCIIWSSLISEYMMTLLLHLQFYWIYNLKLNSTRILWTGKSHRKTVAHSTNKTHFSNNVVSFTFLKESFCNQTTLLVMRYNQPMGSAKPRIFRIIS